MPISAPLPSLAERQTELTRKLILDAALEVLQTAPPGELTMRLVAKHAAISERTVFRYFATRDEFLDAVADAFRARLDLPATPRTLEELLSYPRALYTRFEATASLNKAALQSELGPRLRAAQAKTRWIALTRLVDQIAPTCSSRTRKIAAANIRFYLAASSWHYFRFHFGFSLEDSIACAETAIRQAVEGLGVKLPAGT